MTMECRKAGIEDLENTYDWATDPSVRQNSFNSEEIKFENHKKWFEEKIRSEASLFLIFEVDMEKIGLVRFDKNSDHFIIGITVAPNQRGNGYASQMLIKALGEFSNWTRSPVFAYIKQENIASIRAFQKAGFIFDMNMDYHNVPSKLYIWK